MWSPASFSVTNYRSLGPDWRTHVREAAQRCEGVDPGVEVVVAQDAKPFWGIRIPCRKVLAGR